MLAESILFSGRSHSALSEQIAAALDLRLGKIKLETFPDGEIGVHLLDDVHSQDVFVLQSVAQHPNFYLMELFLIIDACKRASARTVTVLLPYFGYARQDRMRKEQPFSAKLMANLLQEAGADRVVVLDLHTEQVQGFFDIPVDHLTAASLLAEVVSSWQLKQLTVVAPDFGSMRLARFFASYLGAELAVLEKRRLNAKQVAVEKIIGDIKGRNLLFVDDIWATGETLKRACATCRAEGAKELYAAVVHGLFVEIAFEDCAIEKMVVTDSVARAPGVLPGPVQVVSVASLFSEHILSLRESTVHSH